MNSSEPPEDIELMALKSPEKALALELAAARALLEEARDYLLRLPAVPLTRDMAKKIDAHLAAPSGFVAKRFLTKALTQRLEWSEYLPTGEPRLGISMDGGPESAIVRVRSPGLISRPAAARQLIREIDAGLVVEMKPPILPSS